MFVEELRRAIMATSRNHLAEISRSIWKGFAAGAVSEADAQQLAELIEARKSLPKVPTEPTRRVGSRPRSSASLERRRVWTTSGWMPSAIAARFTMGEAAALSVVLAEVAVQGQCMLAIGCIAAKAGVCATIVKRALRQARMLGLISVEERRLSYARNLPNIIRVLSPELVTWIALRTRKLQRSSGGIIVSTTKIHTYYNLPETALLAWKTGSRNRVGANTVPLRPKLRVPY